jgi:alpha-glucosidase (family GH31 glycosyl hydrolase)
MSEIEKEDSRREYLPLVNASGGVSDLTSDEKMNPKVNSMSVGSEGGKSPKPQRIIGVETLDDRTFY